MTLSERIARVQAEPRLCAVCSEPEGTGGLGTGLHRYGPTTHDWRARAIVLSPFTRRVLRGELPAKGLSR